MTTLCLSPVTFPVCIRAATILATTVFVKKTANHRLCYYEGAAPECKMPENLTIANGFYPVVANGTGVISVHGEAILDASYANSTYTTPTHVKVVYLQEDLPHLNVVLASANCTLTGSRSNSVRPRLNNIYVEQANITIDNVVVSNIVFAQGLQPLSVSISNVTLGNPIQFAPAYYDVDINLDSANFTNVTGNYVALLHHHGIVTATDTDVIWLPRASSSAETGVISLGSGSNLNVAKLTGIFGSQYQIEQAAGSVVVISAQAKALAEALLLPAIIAGAVVVLSNLDKLAEK